MSRRSALLTDENRALLVNESSLLEEIIARALALIRWKNTLVNKILFIHNEKGFKAGAYYLNNLIVKKLRGLGCLVDCIYPIGIIDLFSKPSSGRHNILSFYSLINRKNNIDRYDIIQGTTYTTIAFLRSKVPVISHFGSTAYGAIKNVPRLEELRRENAHLIDILDDLLKQGVIDCFNVLDKKSIEDISDVETYAAKRSDLVISSSKKVEQELIAKGVPIKKVVLIHNAIGDCWLKFQRARRE